MRKSYPLTPLQEGLLRSARRDAEHAQDVLRFCVAMALAGVGIAAGNLTDVVDGTMIVEMPDPPDLPP